MKERQMCIYTMLALFWVGRNTSGTPRLAWGLPVPTGSECHGACSEAKNVKYVCTQFWRSFMHQASIWVSAFRASSNAFEPGVHCHG